MDSLLTSGPNCKWDTARARSNVATSLNASAVTDNYYPHSMLIISEPTWMYSEATKVREEKDSTILRASKVILNPDYRLEVTMWEKRLPFK